MVLLKRGSPGKFTALFFFWLLRDSRGHPTSRDPFYFVLAETINSLPTYTRGFGGQSICSRPAHFYDDRPFIVLTETKISKLLADT